MFKFPQTIFDATRQCRQDFLYNYIEIVPGYMFSQYQLIKKIHLYYNSHFVEGDYERINGVLRKKPFYNISKWRCDVWSKQLDIDVKDFMLISNNPDTEWNTFLLERELKVWMKRNHMGQVLNQVVQELPIYGSVVLRKVKAEGAGAEVIDLRHFYVDQAAPTLKKARYKIIHHMMTPERLREMREKGVWKNVNEVIDKHTSFAPTQSYEDSGALNITAGEPYANVYEVYMEVPEQWLEGEEGSENWDVNEETGLRNFVYSHWIVAGVGEASIIPAANPQATQTAPVDANGIVLFKEKLKHEDDPFKEVHANKTKGRWIGVGAVEDTFEAQRLRNRYANMEDKAIELASLILLQTRGKTARRNILSDAESGDIFITGDGELSRIDTRQFAMGDFQALKQDYDMLADKMTFSTQLMSGQAPPASSTATAVLNQTQQAGSVFDYKRENVGLFLEEFVHDLVFPDLEKDINAPHRFRFQGSSTEMKAMRRMVARAAVQAAVDKHVADTGRQVTDEEIDEIEQSIMSKLEKAGNRIWIDVQKSFYANLDYDLDLVTTGENRNVAAQLANVQTVLGLIARNPTILDNPVLRRLLFKMMTLVGMNSSELEALESEAQEHTSAAAAGQGGQGQQPGAITPDNLAKVAATMSQASGAGQIPGQPGGGAPIGQFISK